MSRSASSYMLSPLRYPGGKQKLTARLRVYLEAAEVRPKVLVEPFAGGASVALGFLHAGLVERIALADADPLVASFWQVVFSKQCEDLIELVKSEPITLDAWLGHKASDPQDRLEQAWKLLFLNRTSFSGSIAKAAGAIGGLKQESSWKIDCRFNSVRLVHQLLLLNQMSDRVEFVRNQTVDETVRQMDGQNGVFWYFDPPFFAQAEKLYRKCYDEKGHRAFAELVRGLRSDYILSYDEHPLAEELYGQMPGYTHIQMSYSAAGAKAKQKGAREVIVTSLHDRLPAVLVEDAVDQVADQHAGEYRGDDLFAVAAE